jgi:CheY-like chemotaxis protein
MGQEARFAFDRATAAARRTSTVEAGRLDGKLVLPRALCVDDEPCTLSTWSRVLRSLVDPITSLNPLEALSLVEQGGNFAVLLVDVGMPAMNGLELAEAAHKSSPTTVCIVLTGSSEMDSSSLPVGAVFRFMSKLSPLLVLKRSVTEALEQHQRLARASNLTW